MSAQRQHAPEQATRDARPQSQNAGQPTVQRDTEAEIRQFARSLAIGAIRASTARPMLTTELGERAAPRPEGPDGAPCTNEAESA